MESSAKCKSLSGNETALSERGQKPTQTTLKKKKVFSTYLTGTSKRYHEFLMQLALGFK